MSKILKLPFFLQLLCCTCIVLLLLLQSLIFYRHYRDLNHSVQAVVNNDLRQTTRECESILQNLIDSSFDMLHRLASFWAVSGNGDDTPFRDFLRNSENSGYIMGIMDTSGMIYFSDIKRADVSDKDFFTRIMNGEDVISDAMPVKYADGSQRESVLLGVPLIINGTSYGGLCIIFDSLYWGNLLLREDIEGIGTNMVIDTEGRLIATHEDMRYFANFYDMMVKRGFITEQEVPSLKKNINTFPSGSFTYKNKDSSALRYVYHQKAGVKDWIILSLIVHEAYDTTFWDLKNESIAVFIKTVVISLLICGFVGAFIFLRKKERQQQLRDSLTNVYTRVAARRIVEKDLHGANNGAAGKNEIANGTESPFLTGHFNCCMFLDIDNFKSFNDTKGHSYGDSVLKETANLLVQTLNRNDIVSRYGGDEFNIWCFGVSGKDYAVQQAESLVQAFRTKSEIRISLGVTMIRCGETDVSKILMRADKALYKAKSRGKNGFVFAD